MTERAADVTKTARCGLRVRERESMGLATGVEGGCHCLVANVVALGCNGMGRLDEVFGSSAPTDRAGPTVARDSKKGEAWSCSGIGADRREDAGR